MGSNQFAHIEASAPVQVYQFAKTTANRNTDEADPAMMVSSRLLVYYGCVVYILIG